MVEDGIQNQEMDDRVKTMDLAEILYQSVR